jgi:hypothetical protein
MPVSLGRRIRRFGIPLKEGRAPDWHAHIGGVALASLTALALERRILAKSKLQMPAKEHRRSRNRRKVVREDKVVVKGKK